MYVNQIGWFAQSQQTLHSGQGAILQTSWHGSFIIWATENGNQAIKQTKII